MRWLSPWLCLILLVCAAPAAAQTAIHRCVGADGNALFTDQPCSALQATPLKPVAQPDSTAVPLLCAASLGALKQGVAEAFANHDANRMAGLMLWNGYGHGAAVADIRSLAAMMRESLLDFGRPGESMAATAVPGLDAPAGTAGPVAPAPGDRLVLHTTGSDGSGKPHELRFTIVRRSGCLWLRNAD
jgi:hypothetical protein